MFGTPFSNDELSKYTAIFGTLFNNITITRDDKDGTQLQAFKVALAYGPREKALARTESDAALDRPYAELLPRMAFEIIDITYDAQRKRQSTQTWKTRVSNPNGRISYNTMFAPVPYDLTFKLTILANRMKDANRILGSILPYFRPDITVSASIVDEMPDYVTDIPVVLKSVNHIDDYEGEFTKKRLIEYHLEFVMKAELFGPVAEAKIIKVAKINMHEGYDSPNADKILERYTNQPGLTADGKPTTDITKSISPFQIDEDDDYGYIVTIQDKDID